MGRKTEQGLEVAIHSDAASTGRESPKLFARNLFQDENCLKIICPLLPTLKKKNLNSNSLYLHTPSFITSQLVLSANCP